MQNAVWNPHQTNEIIAVGPTLSGWDLRSGQHSFALPCHHNSLIRAVDYNPNKPYHIATGGDDALVNLWDIRQLDKPLMEVEGHTHWIWSVAFNPSQDQLLLTSSSDTLVNLHNVVSVSSASYLDDELSSEEEDQSDSGRRT